MRLVSDDKPNLSLKKKKVKRTLPLGLNDLPPNYKTKVGIVMADKFSLISNVLEKLTVILPKKKPNQIFIAQSPGVRIVWSLSNVMLN